MPAHFGKAPRAALTASRVSLRDARATFCPSAMYVRPDSERGKAPPMKSLYVFRTGRRFAATAIRLADPARFRTTGTARGRATRPRGRNPAPFSRPTGRAGGKGVYV